MAKTDASACNRCSSCADACPMGLTHVREEKEKRSLNDPRCILCLRCVEQCPRDGCLDVRFFGAPLARSSFKPGRTARGTGEQSTSPSAGSGSRAPSRE